jgi:nucleoside-diphosphate-sugar epimerase
VSVVVTGAAGFIGSALVADLLAAGYQVTAVDRRPLADLPAGAAAISADLLGPGRQAAAVREALRTAEAVFHLAGRAGVRDGDPAAPALRHRDNVLATASVLAGVPAGTPLVVASSSSVYGGSRAGRASAEGDPLRPRGGYARSKAAVEDLCRRRLASGGTVAVARPFTVAGRRQRPDMALARWAAAASRGDPITVYGSLRRTRDITDVRDAATALRLMAERGVTGPLNIGTGRPYTLGDLAAAIHRTVGPAPVQVIPAPRTDPPHTRADTRLAYRRLGFTPRTDLDATVRSLLAREVAAR